MPLVCSVERRMSATLKMISYGGKLSLLNSVITSLTIFALCTLRLPAKIIELLDKITRKCLWTKKIEQGDKCNSLAAWDMVCRLKDCGGLGFLNIRTQGDALLLKYLHKFYNQWDLPWVELLWDTYYQNKIPHASDPCRSFWWRDITKLMLIYRGISQVSVSHGGNVLFWKDLWCNSILAESFPRAFSFATSEDVFVQDFLSATVLEETFHLPLSAQAHAKVRELQSQTRETTLTTLHTGVDKWTYVWGTSEFTSHKYYTFCFRDVHAHQSYKWIWKSKSTMKIKVFGWLLLLDRLNTWNMLKHRHYNIRDNHDCILCGLPIEEIVEHLFFDCSFSLGC